MALPFLEVTGTNVSALVGAQVGRPVNIGQLVRSFDGTMLKETRGTKWEWTVITAPLASTAAQSLINTLLSAVAQQCRGTMIKHSHGSTGFVSCHFQIETTTPLTTFDVTPKIPDWQVTFQMQEV